MPIIHPVCLRRSVAALAALDVKTPSPALLPCGRRRAGETKRQSGSQPGLPPLPAGIPVGAWSTRSGTQCRCLSPLSFVVVAAPSHGAVFPLSLWERGRVRGNTSGIIPATSPEKRRQQAAACRATRPGVPDRPASIGNLQADRPWTP